MNLRLGFLTILLPVLASSCFDAELSLEAVSKPAGVKISVPASQVVVGSTLQASASGGTAPYQFSIDSGGIGSIDLGTGLYTAPTSTGTANLRAVDSVGDQDFVAISVVAAAVATSHSQVLADAATAPADGVATVTVTVRLRDGYGNPVSGKVVSLASSRGASDIISPPSMSTPASGDAVFSVKSTVAGTSGYTATDSTDSIVLTQTPSVQYVAGAVSASVSTVTAGTTTVLADGVATSTITVTLKDAQSNVISGKQVSLASSRGASDTISPASATTDASGQAAFTVKSSVLGTAAFTATDVTDSLPVTQTAGVQFVPGPGNAAASTVSTSSALVSANGTATATITVTLYDAYGHLVSGKTVNLASSRGASDTISPASGTTNASGQVAFTVSSLSVGTSVFTATDTSDSVTITQTASVQFTNTPSAALSTVAASTSPVVANGIASSTITVTLKDGTGAALSGKTVALSSSRGGYDAISPASAVTNGSGQASFTVTSTLAGSAAFTATESGEGIVVTQTASVQFVAGPVHVSTSTVIASQTIVPSDGVTTSVLTVTLKDVYNNPVSGKTVSLTSSRGASDLISPAAGTSDALGAVTFSVASSLVGNAVLSARDETDSLNLVQTPTLAFMNGGNIIDFTIPATITAANVATYNNKAWIVRGGVTVTLDLNSGLSLLGLNIVSGGVLTHSVCTLASCSKIDLAVSGNVDIESGGSVSATGKGYLGGMVSPNVATPGITNGFIAGSGQDCGGSHGGYGGESQYTGHGSPSAPFGDFLNPTTPGGGGGAYSTNPGGSGGGTIRLSCTGRLRIDGTIAANGVESGGAGSGAGGSVWLQLNEITGTGSVSAVGGSGYSGGGGGRIAIYYTSATGWSLSNTTVQAAGGSGSSSYHAGAGSIYVQQGASPGNLLFDNANRVGNYLQTPLALSNHLNLGVLRIDRSASVKQMSSAFNLSGVEYGIFTGSTFYTPDNVSIGYGPWFNFTSAAPGSALPTEY